MRIVIVLLVLGALVSFALSTRKKEKPPAIDPVAKNTPKTTLLPKNDYMAEPDPSAQLPYDNGARMAMTTKTAFAFDITLDPQNNTLSCLQETEIFNSSDKPLSAVVFRFYPGAVGKATLADVELKFPWEYKSVPLSMDRIMLNASEIEGALEDDGTTLRIQLPYELKSKESTRVILSYTQTLPRSVFDYGYNVRGYNLAWFYAIPAPLHNGEWVIEEVANDGSPFTAEASDYIASIHLPLDYALTCTGSIDRIAQNEHGKTYFVSAPSAADFAFHADNRTTAQAETAQGVFITVRAGYADKIALLKKLTAGILDEYDGLYGTFPYKSLTVSQASLYQETVEHSSLILVDATCVQGDESKLEYALARAIARQWFGCSLSAAREGQWLNNALCEYAATAYFEQKYGAQKGEAVYQAHIAHQLPGKPPLLKPHEIAADTQASSFAGAMMLRELSLELTAAEFNTAMKSYTAKYANGRGSLRALVDEFTTVNADASALFIKWIDFSAG